VHPFLAAVWRNNFFRVVMGILLLLGPVLAGAVMLGHGLPSVVGVPLSIVGYLALVYLIERRSCTELSIKRAHYWVYGFVVGAVAFTATFALIALLAHVDITLSAGLTGLSQTASLMMAAAFFEELLFRGVIYRLSESSLGTTIAMVLSAVIFGLSHAFNPGASALSTISIALQAGLLLAAAYTYSRTLWFPIGIHFAWNWFEGGVFGAAVSGGNVPGYFKSVFQGPNWVVGGVFGPEASIPANVVALCAFAIIATLAWRKGRWVSFREARRARANDRFGRSLRDLQ
jgi:membrane protease YdiL (CAAX protease family)